jgi:branched-chain amino acid transport system permease protein
MGAPPGFAAAMAGTSPRRRLWLWSGYAAVLLVAPLVLRGGLAQALLVQTGIAIIACLAYNILLGQGGMLSFGHAVYSGFGAYLTIHTLHLVSAGRLALPVTLLPLVGGAAGFLLAAVLGWVCTRKSGTTFSMITLGLGELVWSLALMLPDYSGGEGGVAGNRVVGAPVLGIGYGSQLQFYGLVAGYCFVCTASMYALTRTPLGRLLNAVRDNPERVAFIGCDPRRVRFIAFAISGGFMGIAGGLGALNFEIVTVEVVGAARSASLLLFTVLGGVGPFYGPILGAVLMVLAQGLLSQLTQAWPLYTGLLFLVFVSLAPGGVAGLIEDYRSRPVQVRGPLAASGLALAGSALTALLGVAAMVEMAYQLHGGTGGGTRLRLGGAPLDAAALDSWAGAGLLLVTGLVLFEPAWRRARSAWQAAPPAAGRPAGERPR